MAERVPEQNALLRESIDVGACVSLVTITSKMIGSECVDGYKDKIYIMGFPGTSR
jgi:hypothetical protein